MSQQQIKVKLKRIDLEIPPLKSASTNEAIEQLALLVVDRAGKEMDSQDSAVAIGAIRQIQPFIVNATICANDGTTIACSLLLSPLPVAALVSADEEEAPARGEGH